MSDVTQILFQIEEGDPQAADKLLPLIYDELRRLAANKMAQERPDHSLQATALVHEAYLRLVDVEQVQQWNSRGHFFAAAAEAMRRILVESARRKNSLKHGGNHAHIELPDDVTMGEVPSNDMLLALDQALAELESQDPIKAQVVKLRFFAGLTLQETAAALAISAITARRYWRYARSWLYGRMAATKKNPKT